VFTTLTAEHEALAEAPRNISLDAPTAPGYARLDDERPEPDLGLIPLNAATIALADEILALPSAATASKTAQLLWGPEMQLPAAMLDAIGSGIRLPLGALLRLPGPLAALIPSRLKLVTRWDDPASALRGARALASGRYRQLQTVFVGMTARRESRGTPSLVRYTYGTGGDRLWAESAQRILDRVVVLNREALGVLGPARPGAARLPGAVLDVLARALPPVAVPDFPRIAAATPSINGHAEDTVERYRSLFAEMLGLVSDPEASR
jgi:hypothetical protein